MDKPKVYYDSKSENGNIYEILALVWQKLKEQKMQKTFEGIKSRVFKCKSYLEALDEIKKDIELIDTSVEK